jgi:hypothetical protein
MTTETLLWFPDLVRLLSVRRRWRGLPGALTHFVGDLGGRDDVEVAATA